MYQVHIYILIISDYKITLTFYVPLKCNSVAGSIFNICSAFDILSEGYSLKVIALSGFCAKQSFDQKPRWRRGLHVKKKRVRTRNERNRYFPNIKRRINSSRLRRLCAVR